MLPASIWAASSTTTNLLIMIQAVLTNTLVIQRRAWEMDELLIRVPVVESPIRK